MTSQEGASMRLHLTPVAEVPEVTVTGTLPMGDTTGIVTYLITDTTTNGVVGQVVLPTNKMQPSQ